MIMNYFWSSKKSAIETSHDNDDDNDDAEDDESSKAMPETETTTTPTDTKESLPQQQEEEQEQHPTTSWTTTVGNSCGSRPRPQTWKEAHLQCSLQLVEQIGDTTGSTNAAVVKQQQSTLAPSPQQVIDSLFDDGDELEWNLPKRKDKNILLVPVKNKNKENYDKEMQTMAERAMRILEDQQKQQKQQKQKQLPAASKTSFLYSTVTSVVNVVSSALVYGTMTREEQDFFHSTPSKKQTRNYYDDDDDDDDDDYYRTHDKDSATYTYDEDGISNCICPLEEPILNLELSHGCLQLLLERIEQDLKHEDLPLILYRYQPTPSADKNNNISLPETKPWSWLDWCRNVATEEEERNSSTSTAIISSLSEMDAEILLHLVVAHHHARIVGREEDSRSDLVAIGRQELLKNKESSSSSSASSNVDISVCLWDLDLAQQNVERQLESWNDQIHTCEQRALKYHRKSKQLPSSSLSSSSSLNLAKRELQKRKMLQDRVDSSQEILLNLERTKHTILQSLSDKTIFQTLASTRDTLQHLHATREDASTTTTILDDLALEREELQTITDALATSYNTNSMPMTSTYDINEEELANELEELDLDDNYNDNNNNSDNNTNQGNKSTESDMTTNNVEAVPATKEPTEKTNCKALVAL